MKGTMPSTMWLDMHPGKTLADFERAQGSSKLLNPGKIQYHSPAKKKVVKKSNVTIPHIRIPKEFLMDMTDPIKSTPLGLYWFLRRYVWTDHHSKDIYKLYTKYYLKGMLGCTYSMPKLAEIFGRDRSTIDTWIKLLRDKGWLEYGDKVGRDGQNTYILGVIGRDGEELYYADNMPR